MSDTFPEIIHRSKTIGMGPDETIVGSEPDSAENAIDRRVEFKIIDCVGL
jgi:outer membrane protein OmpA-like peptidoglycan-associated protein